MTAFFQNYITKYDGLLPLDKLWLFNCVVHIAGGMRDIRNRAVLVYVIAAGIGREYLLVPLHTGPVNVYIIRACSFRGGNIAVHLTSSNHLTLVIQTELIRVRGKRICKFGRG